MIGFMADLTFARICMMLLSSGLGISQINGADCASPALNYAEQLFAEGLYEDAYQEYQKIIQSTDSSQPAPFILIRQAECLIEQQNYEKAAELLSSHSPGFFGSEANQYLYLLAVSYRHSGRHSEALSLLNSLKNEFKKK